MKQYKFYVKTYTFKIIYYKLKISVIDRKETIKRKLINLKICFLKILDSFKD